MWLRKGHSLGTNACKLEWVGGGAWLGVEPAVGAERSVLMSSMMLLVEEDRSSKSSRQSHRMPTRDQI